MKCNKDTLNTPYKAGLTSGIDTGTAIISMGSVNYGVIFYLPDGGTATAPYICKKTNGTWGDWVCLSTTADIQIVRVSGKTASGSNIVTATVPGLETGKACIVTCNTTTTNYILCAAPIGKNTLEVRFANNFQSVATTWLSVVFEP